MRLVFLSDIHFGEAQDLRAYHFALSLLERMQPDAIFLGGDVFDHLAVSNYAKHPESILTLQSELDTGFSELTLLREACPAAKIDFYRGNHEKRFDKYLIGQAKPLAGLKALEVPSLYRLNELDINYVGEANPVKKGHLVLAHGDEFPTGGTNPAERALRDMNVNLLFGHVHKVSVAHRRNFSDRTISAWSNNCLCNLKPGYKLNPHWTQGFSIVDFAPRGYFSITPVTFWTETKHRKLAAMVDGEYHTE